MRTKLLIADDEALEREGLEWIIARAMPETFEIIHAENGRKAIQLAEQHRPDIVMMDVKMPGIQGLEALKEIKAINAGVKMVLVTAYDYFGYAKQALSLGVKDYIVKPAKPEQIILMLTQLTVELEQERSKRNNELALRDKCSQLMMLVENELALMLMTGQVQDFDLEQISVMAEFHFRKGYAIAIALRDGAAREKPDYRIELEKIYQSVKRFAAHYGTCIVSSIVQGQMAIFVQLEEDALYSMGEVMACGDRLLQLLQKTSPIATSVGVGSLQTGLENMRNSYLEAARAAKHGIAKQVKAAIHYSEITSCAEKADTMGALHEGWGGMSDSEPIHIVAQQVPNNREQEVASLLEQARAYIDKHFHEEISMEKVARMVHITPFYFSKLFKQHFSETFIDYITGLRIMLARNLIEETDMTLKEICYKVGYRDPNYFSRVFKKITGVSPMDYRRYHS